MSTETEAGMRTGVFDRSVKSYKGPWSDGTLSDFYKVLRDRLSVIDCILRGSSSRGFYDIHSIEYLAFVGLAEELAMQSLIFVLTDL